MEGMIEYALAAISRDDFQAQPSKLFAFVSRYGRHIEDGLRYRYSREESREAFAHHVDRFNTDARKPNFVRVTGAEIRAALPDLKGPRLYTFAARHPSAPSRPPCIGGRVLGARELFDSSYGRIAHTSKAVLRPSYVPPEDLDLLNRLWPAPVEPAAVAKAVPRATAPAKSTTRRAARDRPARQIVTPSATSSLVAAVPLRKVASEELPRTHASRGLAKKYIGARRPEYPPLVARAPPLAPSASESSLGDPLPWGQGGLLRSPSSRLQVLSPDLPSFENVADPASLRELATDRWTVLAQHIKAAHRLSFEIVRIAELEAARTSRPFGSALPGRPEYPFFPTGGTGSLAAVPVTAAAYGHTLSAVLYSQPSAAPPPPSAPDYEMVDLPAEPVAGASRFGTADCPA